MLKAGGVLQVSEIKELLLKGDAGPHCITLSGGAGLSLLLGCAVAQLFLQVVVCLVPKVLFFPSLSYKRCASAITMDVLQHALG